MSDDDPDFFVKNLVSIRSQERRALSIGTEFLLSGGWASVSGVPRDWLVDKRPVAPERTGWRDQAISERHRPWGYALPALDLDFVLLEYDYGRAVAIVEYKHERAFRLKLEHPSYLALADLADRAGLPAFVVRYAADFSWWRVTPLNVIAANITAQTQFTEREWFHFLHRLRRRPRGETIQ